MPVNWVDGVTPVNAANLETMEADTAAKQALTEKAAANGYAPLDATAKVPLVHLPPVSGVDYIGTWGSGIAYKRGDVVRYGSNDYLAVNDSTGVTPPAAYAPPLGGVSIGTSLPASPYDGQEFVLTDSLTAPKYSWRFRYNAGSASAYKWEFVGGPPLVAWEAVDAAAGATQVVYQPSFTAPRNGDYVLRIAGFTYSATVDAALAISVRRLDTTLYGAEVSVGVHRAGTPQAFSLEQRIDGLTAGDSLAHGYKGLSGISNVRQRQIATTPVRVA